MAEDKNKPEGVNDEAQEGEEEGGEQKKKSKLIPIIIAAVLLVGGAGAGGFFFLTSKDKPVEGAAAEGEDAATSAEPAKPAESFFFELPDMTVNLSSTGGGARFLRLKSVLEVGSAADVTALEKIQPRIVDDFQVYLRELRPSDLQGSAGSYRLRHDLLLRANQAAQPVHVHNVLFKELIVQ